MSETIDGNTIRRVLLEVVEQQEKHNASSMQSGGILQNASKELGIRNDPPNEQALLTLFYDLFRNGHWLGEST